MKKKIIAGICAAAVVVVGVGVALGRTPSYAIAEAKYPDMAHYPSEWALTFESDYNAWRADRMALRESRFDGYDEGLKAFTKEALPALLSGAGNVNRVASPLNVYMALSMLTELTDGNSRAQLLELLHAPDADTQRQRAEALWKYNYSDDGATTLILANSIWLDDGISYSEEPLKRLAANYFASSYQGDMADSAYTSAMKRWLNEQTGGLLRDAVGEIEVDPKTIVTLLSTIYYQAKWDNEFREEKNETLPFHTPTGDVETTFMCKSSEGSYYWGDTFAAITQSIENAGRMWFFLPDEGVSVDEMLKDEGICAILNGESWENSKRLIIDLKIPKFDVSSKLKLRETLESLGVTDIFDDASADFTPLLDADQPAWISDVEHAARVIIDEEGIQAAAYTAMMMAGAAEPPDERVEIVFDRPFLFAVTGTDGAVLFAGVVNNP
ncbi:MAG: serpin family protein [Clostridia bacterium]|nr:serpin family protein [Clostridia bacterium]